MVFPFSHSHHGPIARDAAWHRATELFASRGKRRSAGHERKMSGAARAMGEGGAGVLIYIHIYKYIYIYTIYII